MPNTEMHVTAGLSTTRCSFPPCMSCLGRHGAGLARALAWMKRRLRRCLWNFVAGLLRVSPQGASGTGTQQDHQPTMPTSASCFLCGKMAFQHTHTTPRGVPQTNQIRQEQPVLVAFFLFALPTLYVLSAPWRQNWCCPSGASHAHKAAERSDICFSLAASLATPGETQILYDPLNLKG